MYSITKNIKRTSFLLISIGIICLGFGFFESLSSHVSDKEIKYKVNEVYKKYNKDLNKSSLEDSLNFYQRLHDNLILERDSIMRTNFVQSEGYTNWLTDLTKNKESIEIKINEFELNNSDVMLLIFSEIEKDLNCHFTSSEIEKAKDKEDICCHETLFSCKSTTPMVKYFVVQSILFDGCCCSWIMVGDSIRC